MKKTKVILLINLFFVFGLSAQSLDLSMHLNFTNEELFKSGLGIEIAFFTNWNNRFQIQPTLAFSSLNNKIEYRESDGSISVAYRVKIGFLSAGTAIFYSLLSNEKQQLLIGPNLNLIFWPKKSWGFFYKKYGTITPHEFRFHVALNTTFRQKLNDKFGIKTYLEFGYHTKSNLKEGTDYPQNYDFRTYQDFTNLKVGLGIFYSIK